MILLRNWKTVWIYFEYDELKNRLLKTKVLLNSELPNYEGYGVKERLAFGKKEFFCTYKIGYDVFFQAGKNIWKINKSHRSTFSRIGRFSYLFELYLDSEKVYSCTYFNFSTFLAEKFDNTFDGLDFQEDHFLYFMFENVFSQIKTTPSTGLVTCAKNEVVLKKRPTNETT